MIRRWLVALHQMLCGWSGHFYMLTREKGRYVIRCEGCDAVKPEHHYGGASED